jgi:hypothetical protein
MLKTILKIYNQPSKHLCVNSETIRELLTTNSDLHKLETIVLHSY